MSDSEDAPATSTDEENNYSGSLEEHDGSEEEDYTEDDDDISPGEDTNEDDEKFDSGDEKEAPAGGYGYESGSEEEKPKKSKPKRVRRKGDGDKEPKDTKVPETAPEKLALGLSEEQKKKQDKHTIRFSQQFSTAIFGLPDLVNAKAHALSNTFSEFAIQIAPLIITEKDFENFLKKFPQASMGGTAGGDKFIAHGILFKYALDAIPDPPQTDTDETSLLAKPYFLYGMFRRRDDLAMKAAGHQMMGLTHLMCTEYLILVPNKIKKINQRNLNEAERNAEIQEIQENTFRFPLEIVIDHLSYRLTASTMLPLGKDSLLYGSNDAGRSVLNQQEIHVKMLELADVLHLQKHYVAHKEVAMCGDLEGHKGTDGQFYVLDTARVFPPDKPPSDFGAYVFSRMLRPELLRAFYKETNIKLCSDGFTGFQRTDPNFNQYNRDIIEASKFLDASQIPKFANELSKKDNITITKGYINASYEYASPKTAQFFSRRFTDPIIRRLHEFGINLRSLHKVRNQLPSLYSQEDDDDDATLDEKVYKGPDDGRMLEEFLLSLMVCRVLKNHWRVQSQAALMKEVGKTPSDVVKIVSARVLTECCQNSIINDENVQTGKQEHGPFWDIIIKKGLVRMHGENYLLPGEELEMRKIRMQFVLIRMCQICGVFLTRAALDNIASCKTEELFFTVLDIREIIPKLKFPAILDFYSGLFLLEESTKKRVAGEHLERKKLMQQAEEKLAAAYSSYTQEIMGYQFAKALYGSKVINPKRFYDLKFAAQRFTKFLRKWIKENKALLDKIDPWRREENSNITLKIDDDPAKREEALAKIAEIEKERHDLYQKLTPAEHKVMYEYWSTLMMFICSILFQISDKEKKNTTLKVLLGRVMPKNFPPTVTAKKVVKGSDDENNAKPKHIPYLYPARIAKVAKPDADERDKEDYQEKQELVELNSTTLFSKEGYTEIYRREPGVMKIALEDLANFPYHGKREILQTFLDKLPVGVRDFCDPGCKIPVVPKTDHARHKYEKPYRCELDCKEDHEHNLCDFNCCIGFAENQTSRSEQYVFYEKAKSLSDKKGDDRFLQYIKKLEGEAALILREAMQGRKSESARLVDFRQKCGTIAIMYPHETHIDYAAIITTIPITLHEKGVTHKQNMIGWNTTEREEPESWFFYIQRLLRFNPIDSTRIRFHVFVPEIFKKQHKEQMEEDEVKAEKEIKIVTWEKDILKVKIDQLKAQFDEALKLKFFYQTERKKWTPTIDELFKGFEKAKNQKEDEAKALKKVSGKDKLPGDHPSIEKLRSADKNYRASKFEHDALLKIRINNINEQLKDIALEIKLNLEKVDKNEKLEGIYAKAIKVDGKVLSEEKQRPLLTKLDNELKRKREKFKNENGHTEYKTSDVAVLNFTPEEKTMLLDVEYAVRVAISEDSFANFDKQLRTIPEIDRYGEKKKEWDKFVEDLDTKEKNLTPDQKAQMIKERDEKEKKNHEEKYIRESPVSSMNEYIKIEIEKSYTPREYFFTLRFVDSCRRKPDYDDEKEYELNEKVEEKDLTGLSLRNYVKRRFFDNNKDEFEKSYKPPPEANIFPDEKAEKKEPTPEDLEKIKEVQKEKLHTFCANQCADKMEEYVFRGLFFQRVYENSFAQCRATGYDWMILDCLNTVDFVTHVLKCELIIYLGNGNEKALAYWKSRGRKFYHFVWNYMDKVISEIKRNEDKPESREFMKPWLKGLILLTQYTLFGYTETYDIFERLLTENILQNEPLYERALIDVFLASWGLVEFIRDPLQDKYNQLASQTSKWEYEKLKLPKSEPGKGILVKPPRSHWQEVLSGRMTWDELKVDLAHIFNIVKGFHPYPEKEGEQPAPYSEDEKKQLFLISTNWKKTINDRAHLDHQIAMERKEKADNEEKKREEEKKKETKKLTWQEIISSSVLFETSDESAKDEEYNPETAKTSLLPESPLQDEKKVFQFFQAKMKKDPHDPTKKYLSKERLTEQDFVNELSSTEKAQKALKFITQFESAINVTHTLLSMDENRIEVFDWIMDDWRVDPEPEGAPQLKVNQNLQRALIDCIVDLSIFPEGRTFFQHMLKHLSKQVEVEAHQEEEIKKDPKDEPKSSSN